MFPVTFKEAQQLIEVEEVRAKEDETALAARAKQIEEDRKRIRARTEYAQVLANTLNSWQWPDPGKQGCYFFLASGGRYGPERVVVRELLPEETKIFSSHEEWQKYSLGKGYQWRYDAVPSHRRVASWDEVIRKECPTCHLSQPVVESTFQTLDSPEGDTWERGKHILCFGCRQVHQLSKESWDN